MLDREKPYDDLPPLPEAGRCRVPQSVEKSCRSGLCPGGTLAARSSRRIANPARILPWFRHRRHEPPRRAVRRKSAHNIGTTSTSALSRDGRRPREERQVPECMSELAMKRPNQCNPRTCATVPEQPALLREPIAARAKDRPLVTASILVVHRPSRHHGNRPVFRRGRSASFPGHTRPARSIAAHRGIPGGVQCPERQVLAEQKVAPTAGAGESRGENLHERVIRIERGPTSARNSTARLRGRSGVCNSMAIHHLPTAMDAPGRDLMPALIHCAIQAPRHSRPSTRSPTTSSRTRPALRIAAASTSSPGCREPEFSACRRAKSGPNPPRPDQRDRNGDRSILARIRTDDPASSAARGRVEWSSCGPNVRSSIPGECQRRETPDRLALSQRTRRHRPAARGASRTRGVLRE